MSHRTWETVLPQRLSLSLRDSPDIDPVYASEDLVDVVVLAAKMVSGDLDLDGTYTINTEATTISPDPVSGDTSTNTDGTEHEAFTNMILLKAQIVLATGEWRKAVRGAVDVNAGNRIRINTWVKSRALKDYVESLKDDYNRERRKFMLNNLGGTRRGIMSGAPTGDNYGEGSSNEPFGLGIVH
jgi:hypothetical protein